MYVYDGEVVRSYGTSEIEQFTWKKSEEDECVEWQVNYGYQKFCKLLIKIQKKHLKLTIFLSSIPDQKSIFIPISHIATSHTHKSSTNCLLIRN